MKNNFKENSLIILILLIVVGESMITTPLKTLDEIWIYNMARNISDNLLPYKDFNMVVTPLLSIICGIILKITFNELIVMRILAIFLITAIFYMIYKILEILGVKKSIISLVLIIIFYLFNNYFCIDYNYSVLLIILITIYNELKNTSKEILDIKPRNDFFLGILVGTTILFKHTTGLFVSIVFIFYKLFAVSNKEEFKKFLKIACIRFLGILIPIILLIYYLTINNIWSEFLDYTVYSIPTFTNKILYSKLLNGYYGNDFKILSIIVPCIVLVMLLMCFIYKNKKSEDRRNMLILFVYSISASIVIYPISDNIHFFIGSLPILISFVYIIYSAGRSIAEKYDVKKLVNVLNYILKGCIIELLLILLLIKIESLITYIKTAKNYNEFLHFRYINIEMSEDIKVIDEFILNQNSLDKDVYILDATAALYMIPLNKYNKDYDLFLKGNIGAEGEDGQIKKLEKEDENTIVLIKNKNYIRNWQNPEKVRNYIINNWAKTGEIGCFDIYEKNNIGEINEK